MTLHRSPTRTVGTSTLCLSFEARELDTLRLGAAAAAVDKRQPSPINTRPPSSACSDPRRQSSASARSITPVPRGHTLGSAAKLPASRTSPIRRGRVGREFGAVGLDEEVFQAEQQVGGSGSPYGRDGHLMSSRTSTQTTVVRQGLTRYPARRSEFKAPPSPRNSFRPFAFPQGAEERRSAFPPTSPPRAPTLRRSSTSPASTSAADVESRIRRCSRGWDLERLGRPSPPGASPASFLDFGFDEPRSAPPPPAASTSKTIVGVVPGSPQSFLDFDAMRPGSWGRKSKEALRASSSLRSMSEASDGAAEVAQRSRQVSGGLELCLGDERTRPPTDRTEEVEPRDEDPHEPLKTPTPESVALFSSFPVDDEIPPPAPPSMPISSPPITRRSTIDLPPPLDPADSPHSPVLSQSRLSSRPTTSMGLAHRSTRRSRRVRTFSSDSTSSGYDSEGGLDSPFSDSAGDESDETLTWSPYSSDVGGSFTPDATCSPCTSSESEYSPRTPLHLELVDGSFQGPMATPQDFGLGLFATDKGPTRRIEMPPRVTRAQRAQSLGDRRRPEGASIERSMPLPSGYGPEATRRTPAMRPNQLPPGLRRNTLATSAPAAPSRRPSTPPSIRLHVAGNPPSAPLARSNSLRGDTPSSRERRRRPVKAGPIAGRVLFGEAEPMSFGAPTMQREKPTSVASPSGSLSLPALSSVDLGLSSEKLDRSLSAPGFNMRQEEPETLSPRRQYGRREGIRETGQWTRVDLQMVQLARRRDFDDEELAQLRLVEHAKQSRRAGRMLIARGLGIM